MKRANFESISVSSSRIALFFCFLNLGLVLLLANLKTPSQAEGQAFIAFRSNGLLLLQPTKMGIPKIETAKTWKQMLLLVQNASLQIPNISYANLPAANEVKIERIKIKHQSDSYKISWRTEQSEYFIYAPDLETAQALTPFIKYQGLDTGPYGFALALKL